MKRFFKIFILILLFLSTSLYASQKQTDNIANISAVSLYNIDKNSLQKTIKAFIKSNPNLKALKITEKLSKEIYIQFYRENGNLIFDAASENYLKNLKKYDSLSIYENENVGEIIAYYENKIFSSSNKLSKSENQWLKQNPPIRIAVVNNYPPYDFTDKDKNLKGFHSDILELMNKNLGINISLKPFDSWTQAYDAVIKGSVNAIFSLSWSQEREEKYFNYSSPYHFSPYYLVVDEKNVDITSIHDLSNKDVSIEKNTIFNKVIKESVPSSNILFTKDTKEAYAFVKNGKAIATISPNINDELFKKSGLKVAAEIFHKSSNIYIGINKKQPIVTSILKKGIDSISLQNIIKLRQKWFTKTNAIIELNQKEKEWIKRNPDVKVIKFFEEPPFTLNTHKKSGYVYELVEYLIESAGLNIKYIDGFKSYGQMLDDLKKGDVDILTTFPTSLNLGEDSNIIKSKSILRTPFVLIGSNTKGSIKSIKDLYGKEVAVVKGYIQDKYLNKFPQIKKIYVKDNDEGFSAIREGKAKYYINNRANSEYILHKTFSTDLDIIFELPYDSFPPLSISFAMNSEKQILVSILKKALDQIPYKKIKQIRDHWIINEVTEKQKIRFTNEEKEWLSNNSMIRLAYMDFWTRDDNEKNIHTEYLELLSKYGNLNIVPVKFNAWKNGFKSASEGNSVHGILKLSWSKEREEKNFNYTKPYSFTPAYLITKKSNNTINTMEDLRNKKIYVKEKTITENIVKELNYNIESISLKNEDEMYKTLGELNSSAEAILSYVNNPELLEKYNLKVVCELLSEYGEVHLGISKNQRELYSIINKVYEVIPKKELRRIQNKTYKKTKKTKIKFTEEEKEFIKKHPRIKIHNEQDWAPFNFYEKGRARGLSIDYIKSLLEKIGIEPEFISGPSWDEFIDMSKSKDIDLMLNIVKSPERKKFLNFTNSYADIIQSVFIKEGSLPVSKIEDLYGKTFAVPKGFYYEEVLKKYPKIKLLRVADTLECMQAVASGKADAMLDLITVVNYYKNKYNIKSLVLGGTLGIEGGSLPLHIGIRKDWPELVSILNKSLSSLSDDEINKIEETWLFNNNQVKKSLISLTDEEKKWIRENEVKVGIEEWAPVVFSTSGSNYDGITGDVLRLVVEKTGLKLEVVNDFWDHLLERFKNKELDLLPATYYTDERASYGLYSDGYYKMLDYIYIKEDNDSIKSLADLKGKTLAIPKGFGTIPKIRKNFPSIEIVESIDLSDSIQKVLRGEVDALYDGQIAVEYKIQEELIVGLRGIPQKSFEAAPLHFFSHIQKPILRDILNKALQSIPSYKINKIKSKWLVEKRNERILNTVDKKQDNKETIWLLTSAVGIFLLLLLILIIITKFISNDFVAKSFGSSKFRLIALIILSIVIFMLASLIYLTLSESKKNILQSTKSDLEFVLKTTQDRLDTWIAERENFLIQMGRDKELVEITKALLKVNKDENSLSVSSELKVVRDYFKKREKEFGNLGFFIIDKNYISIGSGRDNNLGTKNLIAIQNSKLLQMVFNGEAVFIPPMLSDINNKGSKKINEHTMFFAIPIKDNNNNVIAAMTQRLNVEGKFSEIIQSGRIGQSGESYIFSKDGFMLTKSRFRNELINIGLLKDDEKEYRKLQLKDPGGNLLNGFKPKISTDKLPLTKMAKSAILLDKTSLSQYSPISSDINGYRDYRGVEVFGSWLWYNKYDIGLTTEIDVSEALNEFYSLRLNLLIISGFTLLLTVLSVVMLIILGEKATRSIQKANNELNKLLESFDDNVIASKTDARGIIKYASKAFCEISGYTESELIGSPQNIVRHPDSPKSLFENLWTTIKSGKTWRGEVKNKKKNGGFYWVDVVIEPEFDDEQNIIGYSAIRQDISSKKEVEELSENLEVKIEERTLELKKSQEQFSSMAANVPGVIYRCKVDAGWTMIYISNEIEVLSGYPVSDFINNNVRTFANIMHKDDIERVAILIQSQVDKNEKFIVDYRVIDNNGVVKWVRSQGQAYKTEENETWIDGVLYDVTEQKKLEEEIKESEKRFVTLFDAAPDSISILKDSKYIDCNQKTLELFGVESRRAFKKTKPSDYSPEVQENGELSESLASKQILKAVEEGYNRFEWIHKRLDTNKEFYAEVILSSIVLNSERHIYAVVRDISQRKELEKRIQENQDQMTYVSQHANLGFWNFNPQIGDLNVNDVFVKMLGYKPSKVLLSGYENKMFKPFKGGLAFLENLLHPDDVDHTQIAINDHINGKSELYKVDYRMRREDGSWMWSTAIGRISEYDKDGKAIKFNGVNIDIDDSKKAQQALEDQKQYINSIMNSQSNIVISTDGEKLRTANKAFFDFYELSTVEEFLVELGDCICDTFDTSAPKEFIQKMMGEEKWIEYVFNRPEKIHKVMIEKNGVKHIFTITSDRFEFANEMLEVAVFTDISEIEAIRKNIETILSNIMLPVLITSKNDRKILYANEYASIQYETEIEKLIGSSIDNVYASLEQKEEILNVIDDQGYVENLEEKYKTKTGKEFIGLLSVKPIMYNGEDSYIEMVVDITKQKEIEDEIRQIHKHTQSSIEYASLIQHSLIPSNDLFRKYFDDYFTIWHPKDIVGGDIYLFEELRNEDECLLMVIDCTGHGVPGAFVTMLVKAIERQVAAIIAADPNLEVSPAWILKYFNQTMKKLLKQEDEEAISNAGLDGAVLYYNKKQQIVRFSGAEIPLFYCENGEFKTIKGNRHSIGYKKSDADYEFKEYVLEAKEGMQFYLTTDGYLDQNGGNKGFPFGKKRFLSILEKYKDYSFADQQEVLLNELQEYQKDEERNDDISIVGIKISKENMKKDENRESW